MSTTGRHQRQFAGCLAFAIDRHRRKTIGFTIAAVFASIEDVVGREMDKRNLKECCRQGQMTDGNGVQQIGFFGVLLGLVNGGIASGIDDCIRRISLYFPAEAGRIEEIDVVTADKPQACQARPIGCRQLPCQLTTMPDNQNAALRDHHAAPDVPTLPETVLGNVQSMSGTSRNRGNRASFSETVAASTITGHLMPRSGSAQWIPASWLGA